MEEYTYAERKVADGTYRYNMVEYQRFSVRNYKQWVAKLDLTVRF